MTSPPPTAIVGDVDDHAPAVARSRHLLVKRGKTLEESVSNLETVRGLSSRRSLWHRSPKVARTPVIYWRRGWHRRRSTERNHRIERRGQCALVIDGGWTAG